MKSRFRWGALGSVLVVLAFAVLLHRGSQPRSRLEAGSMRVYCAAGLRLPMQEILAEYGQRYDVQFETVYDASGKLISAMRTDEGRGDIFLPADLDYIQDARQHDLIAEVAPIAYQHPCITIQKGSTKVASLNDLTRPDVKLSLADPKVTAISRVAQKLLSGIQHQGKPLWDQLYERATVTRTTVNEVANDVKSGSVDAGIVWDATAVQYPELAMVRVPEFESSRQTISVAVVKTSRQPKRALHYLRFITSRQYGLAAFQRHGYEIAAGDEWSDSPQLTLFTGGLMHPAIQESIQRFEQREGVDVAQVPNGCGILVAKIRLGEHPDAYFACDQSYMTSVREVFPASYDVSGTEMVVITNKQARGLGINGIDDLAVADAKIGLCDPQHSALGDLSKKLLDAHGIWEAVSSKVIDWPSTADRLVEAVVFGALDAAIVYRANTTRQADKLNVYPIDDDRAQAIQPIAVAADSKYPLLTSRLIEQIRSAASRRQFESLGFRWLGE
jgi:molybdenum ABC transporter molybdate-binding protein